MLRSVTPEKRLVVVPGVSTANDQLRESRMVTSLIVTPEKSHHFESSVPVMLLVANTIPVWAPSIVTSEISTSREATLVQSPGPVAIAELTWTPNSLPITSTSVMVMP